MSLLLAGLVFAGTSGGLFLGRWLARRRAASDLEKQGEEGKEAKKASDAKEKDPDAELDEDEKRARAEVEADAPSTKDSERDVAAAKSDEKDKKPKAAPRKVEGPTLVLDGFVCQLGDVIMRLTGEEAWLAGGLVLAEEVAVAALFVAPDAKRDCAIYARTRPRGTILWLEPIDASAILVAGEPPSAVEHGGIRFDRTRRLPLRTRRIGVGAPDVGDAAVVAEYASAGAERLLLLKGNRGEARAWRGLELDEGSFEVIASGASTLDDG